MTAGRTAFDRDLGTAQGEVRDVSVLMADLRGFTTFCERVSPASTAAVLNEYLTAMVDVILDQHGRIQDFIGDGILGVFGAPNDDPDHAWHAALSALKMQKAIQPLRDRWQAQTGTNFALGIALHTGTAFAGIVGPPTKCKYAVVGDLVNAVSRLEGVNRDLGTAIVMSGETLGRVRDRIVAQPRGSFAVRGRSHLIEVFELLGVRGEGTATQELRDPSEVDVFRIAASHGANGWRRNTVRRPAPA